MNLQAISGRGSFQIVKGSMTIAEIKSANWFATRIITKYKGMKIEIKPENFWRTKFEILKNNAKKGGVHYNWKGHISINIWNESEGRERSYLLKSRGVFKRHFELLDKNEHIVLTMKPKLNWRKFGYDYEIEPVKTFEDEEEFMELLIYCGFSANLYMAKKASKSAG